MGFFGKDRREQYRVRLMASVRYSLDGEHWAECDSVNISHKGMLIGCREKLKKRETVHLLFSLPDAGGVLAIEARGRVTRVVKWRGRCLGLAVDFISFPQGQEQLVKQYVDSQLGETMESLARSAFLYPED